MARDSPRTSAVRAGRRRRRRRVAVADWRGRHGRCCRSAAPVAAAADSVAVLVTGAAFVLISSKVNVTICCRWPSSSRSKSSAVRLAHDAAALVSNHHVDQHQIDAGPENRRRRSRRGWLRLRRLLSSDEQSVRHGHCEHERSRGRRRNDVVERSTSESEPQVDGHRAHRPDRQHLTKGWRVDVRVDRRPLHAVQQVHGVDLQRQGAIAAGADVALEHARSAGARRVR